MIYGIFAGMSWALETIVLGIALSLSPFLQTKQAIFMAPFIATFLHDLCSAFWALFYNGLKGNLKSILHVFIHFPEGKYVAFAALIGGPVGMSGYVLAIQYMGASMGAVASAIFPAIGSILAMIFLKEKMRWYQWVFLCFTLLAVFGLGYSSDFVMTNFFMGILGILMCSFGWGSEAVILAKALKNSRVKDEWLLPIRQSSSALFYGVVILPLLNGLEFTWNVIHVPSVIGWICLASLFASISYLCYYKAISSIGASKAMALNVSYSAWALLFSVIFLGQRELLTFSRIFLTFIVLICSIFAATDIDSLRKKGK